MAQFARPSYDVSNTGWTATGGLDLYTAIDDVVVDDNDFIRAQTGTCEVGLGAVLPPTSQSGHSFFFRTKMVVPYLSAPLLQVFLYCGATLIKASPNLDMSLYLSFTDFTVSLSEGEAGTISDYSDLRLRFVITPGIGGYTVDVSQAYFECPDGAGGGGTFDLPLMVAGTRFYDRPNPVGYGARSEIIVSSGDNKPNDSRDWRLKPTTGQGATEAKLCKRCGMWCDGDRAVFYESRMSGAGWYCPDHSPRDHDRGPTAWRI